MRRYWPILVLTLLLSACNREKVVDLDLPEYERELVVECWLEPGKPYRMALTESVGYFDDLELPVINDATAYVIYGTDTIDLLPIPSVDEGRIFNYGAFQTVPYDYSSEFKLYVEDTQGRVVTGSARIKEPVQFTRLEYEFNDVDSALVRVAFTDNPNEENFYLFVLHENGLDTRREIAIELDDRSAQNGEMLLSTLYFRQRGDTAIVSVYSITEDVFDYIESSEAAEGANGNPFAPPTSVLSNVTGGIGIFAGLSVARDSVIIQ